MQEDKKHILVVDDDEGIRTLLGRFLFEQGYAVSMAGNADEAMMFLTQYKFDLLILDVMMPGQNGFDLLKDLRSDNNVPVLMLTAMGETESRILGLQTGADDYLPKPFDTTELILRIKNIFKRLPDKKMPSDVLDFGQCLYDMRLRELKTRDGATIHLTNIEQQLLSLLGHKIGQTFTRENLAELLGGDNNLRSIDVQMTRLRKKIEQDSKNPRYLQTVRGKGYMLLVK